VFLASSFLSCFPQLSLGGPKSSHFYFIYYFSLLRTSSWTFPFCQLLAQVTLFIFIEPSFSSASDSRFFLLFRLEQRLKSGWIKVALSEFGILFIGKSK
jgi:hypothetical protein